MKVVVIKIVCILTFACVLMSCNPKEQEDVKALVPKTEKEKLSYAIGTNIANSIFNIKDKLVTEMLLQGMRDKFSAAQLAISQEEAQTLMQSFNARMKEEQESLFSANSEKNLAEGVKFLAENKTKEGIIETASGLQYKVIKEGDGPVPSSTDTVKVHYLGTTIDGTEFDSSYKRNSPATFPVSGVIKGWTEALLLMKVGSKYKLYIPSELAYGKRGAGKLIGPNTVLIFDVELLSIEG